MNRLKTLKHGLSSFIACASAFTLVLALVAPTAYGCLLAKRLRVVAPHLTEEEVMLYAHGNMDPVKKHYSLAAKTACVGGQADIFTCNGVDLLGHLNLSQIGGGGGNDLWGWTDPVTGAEIALIGRTNGTGIVDVSDPENPVYLGNLPSHSGTSSWRDIKTFADHAFVVADGQPHGIQVFDLTQLRSVTNPPVTFSATAHYSGVGNAHNIVINEATGFAYAVGSNQCSGGLHMVDINTPTSPTFAGCFSADGYTHDAQCIVYDGPDTDHTGKEICFASNEDTLTIVDVTNKGNPIQLSRTDYTQPGNSHYAHQGWLTEDRQYFVFDDEFDEMGQGHNTRTYIWDVSDLDNVSLTGSWDAAGSSVDHNQYIRGNFTYQANYARGLRILELTDLGNAGLTEVAFFDTYPESDGNNFDGAWSTYPYFASGIVLVSDINRGLFILQPQTTDPNNTPSVTISAPADGSSSTVGDSVTFTGSASDVEDGDLTSSLAWTSSVDGSIGSGASFSTTTLSVGSHTITASATDSGGKTGSDSIAITVAPIGGGPQNAIYDAGLGAPSCAAVGSSCDSQALLDGRASNGPEPNQPNTLDSCVDGTSGSYHSDESNDRIVVTTLDASDMVEGATVRVDATVWAWTTPSSDTLDLYYAADAGNPTWVLIGSVSPTASGQQTLSATYTLPAGALQAVRANFRYQGSQSPCSGGSYDDADDLVFAVGTAAACTVNADCDDGAFCNGAETCNVGTGTCEAGTPVSCDDGVSCTVDSCNEATDSCDATPDNSLCDNGLFCDGAETCDAVAGCQAGTAVNCDDGVACTVDACNEGSDSCDNTPDDSACDNGLFCDGAEVCNATLGCQDSADPCTGPGQTCNETSDVCEGGTGCLSEVDFESGAGGWTQGADSCSTGSFVVGSPDSTAWQVGGGNPGNAFYTQPNAGGIGSDDVDGGTCEGLSAVVDANGQAAVEVSLDYFHGQRDAGDDAGDGFTIEVLNNGSVVDTLVSIGDVTNTAAWTNVSTVVANPGNIQLRVRATDAAAGGDIVEGGVDNVSICPTTPPVPCTVEEDFSGGIGSWTTSGSCSTGTFVAAAPTQQTSTVVTQVGGDHTSGSGNALFTATNTGAGTDDVDGGECVVTSPVFNVTDASDLSIWYFHGQRDAGDDASGDYFELEMSVNGGAYAPIVSIGDVQNVAAWTEATSTVPAGSTVQLRVRVSDGASTGDIVEGGIDDLTICPQ